MKLGNFVQATTAHATELAEELSEFDREHLDELCRSVGRDKLLRHIAENEGAMVEYIRRTPAERRRLMAKHNPDPDDRMMYLLCALYVARCAMALLETMQKAEGAEAKYRAMTAWAAGAALELHRTWPTLWPFEDGLDPFGEN